MIQGTGILWICSGTTIALAGTALGIVAAVEGLDATAIVPTITNLGSFALIVWGIVVFLPRAMNDHKEAYEKTAATFSQALVDITKEFHQEIEEVRKRSDMRMESVVKPIERLVERVDRLLTKSGS